MAEPEADIPLSLPVDHLALRGRSGDPALVLRERTLDYATLQREVGQLAAWLSSLSARERWEEGARVASWAGKGLLTCLLPLAAPRAGLVHVPVNPMLKSAQVGHILADSGARALIANRGRRDSLEPDHRPPACTLFEEADAIAQARAHDPAPPCGAGPDALAAILYTSGSTGRPKGVMLSHRNLWLGAQSVAGYLALEPGDRTLAVLPLAFDYGQNQLLSTWYAGGAVVPLDYLFARDVAKAVARERITTLAGVPPLWHDLVEIDWPPEAVAPLRRLTNSGGALGEPLVRALRARFPDAKLFAMYGLTEAFRSTYLDPALIDTHPTSVGRPIPHAEILVMKDARTPAGPGEEGELVHAGPLVALGYWRDAQRSAERFRPAPAQSRHGGTAVWSGDTVRLDEEGLLHFVGRDDAMIKVLGQRISPTEIEDAALATGIVAECVALGAPDPRKGQVVHLVARPVAGHCADSEGLLAQLRRALPSAMVPAVIDWRESLPRTPNGKADRAALAAALR